MENNYHFASRMLHRLVLSKPFIGQTCFDIETSLNRRKNIEIKTPVFVCGLARSGTTILMRTLHDTGVFHSLSYKDMPFVLMPTLWGRISSSFRRVGEEKERSHNDRILIGNESPEAFEEVFWKTFYGKKYIREHGLVSHNISKDLEGKFRQFVANTLAGRERRIYLSKNNNNLLRLAAIKKAFPAAVIIISFRDPVQQAMSLFRQHQLFCKLQTENKFVLDYMNWLGHYEFGLNHKPLLFGKGGKKYAPEDPNYWLEYWCEVYEFTCKNAPQGALFVSYEEFCKNPGQTVAKLLVDIGAQHGELRGLAKKISRKTNPVLEFGNDLQRRAEKCYKALEERVLY